MGKRNRWYRTIGKRKEITMKRVKLSVVDALQKAIPSIVEGAGLRLATLKETIPADEGYAESEGTAEPVRVSMTFCPDPITTTWDWSDLDYKNSNDVPNWNLTIMALILATNCESTIGEHAWSLTENSLKKLGFTNVVHHYFEREEKISRAAMVFARSIRPVHGKYVVAAIYRGSSSIEDAISDVKSELDGFCDAGNAGVERLKEYIISQGLTKENTTLFITGHSYGAANASLVGILSRDKDLAEPDSIFCYPFATPNYNRHGLTGDGMKLFSFDSNEDVVPQVPVGPNLDKTGVDIKFDRLDIQLNQPERYRRFLRLYKYFRGRDFEEDYDFMPDAYSGNRSRVKHQVNSKIVRNHMPYTYMALILSEKPDEVIDTYIGTPEQDEVLVLEMSVGEVYRLPALMKAAKDTSNMVWSSSDEAVASVNERGLLAAKTAGNANLTATTSSGKQAVVEVHVVDE